ncbi:MAG TPA: peptidase S9, partial [Methylococcaceae bacterium]|nr:peptidase S9 [Methylococcaceae bacterium]
MYRKVDLSFRLLWVLWAGLLGNAAFAQDADHFDLWELRVKGNTLLERKEIERTVYPFLGEDKNIDTVEKARAALEEVYQKQGFQTVSVDIPEQDVVGGVVYLEVTEGRVARLRVTDSRYFSLGA